MQRKSIYGTPEGAFREGVGRLGRMPPVRTFSTCEGRRDEEDGSRKEESVRGSLSCGGEGRIPLSKETIGRRTYSQALRSGYATAVVFPIVDFVQIHKRSIQEEFFLLRCIPTCKKANGEATVFSETAFLTFIS